MGKTLAGTLFVYRGRVFDYCFIESIQSLLECCDRVFVVAGGDDNTCEEILDTIHSERLIVKRLSDDEWNSQKGSQKLSYFTNMAIDMAERDGYRYQYNQQADEILSEQSYEKITDAIAGNEDAYFATRINLWKDPFHALEVPQERKPVSTHIIRIAKTKYRSVGDAESLGVPYASPVFIDGIKIIHYGFVRKKDVMKKKVIHIQEEVFGMDHDKKLDVSDVFQPELWFSDEDLIPFNEHPKLISEWIKSRP